MKVYFDAQNLNRIFVMIKAITLVTYIVKHNKTSTEVYIPLPKPVQEIINFEGSFPEVPENA